MVNIQKLISVIHHIKMLKKKKHMIISRYAGKAFDKNLTPTHDKNSQKTRNEEELPQFDKE